MEEDVKFIRLWFADILGHVKGIAITVEELEEALVRGVTFDGSSIQGFARDTEWDMVLLPDPTTFPHPPLAAPTERRGPHVLRHHDPPEYPLRRRSP